MEIEQQDTESKNEYKFIVSLTEDEWDDYLEAAASNLSSEMEVEGFRKGKAPVDMAKSVFGETKLAQAAANQAMSDVFSKVMDEVEVTPIEQPKVTFEELSVDEPLEAQVELTSLPEVEVGDYHEIEIGEPEEPEVSEEEVEDSLKDIQRRAANFSEVERPVEEGDWVEIDFEGTLDGEPFEGGQSKNHPLIVGENVFVPEFEEQLIGMEDGDEQEFDVEFPEDFHQDFLAGETAHFRVKLHQHKEVDMPELTDDFISQQTQFETLEDFKNDIRGKLKNRKIQQAKQAQEEEAIDKLLEMTEADIPATLVDNEVDSMINEQKQRLERQPNMTWEDYLDRTGKTEAELEEELRDEARRRILSSLALAELRKREGIEVTDEDVQQEINKMKQRNKGMEDRVQEQFDDEEEKRRLRAALAGRKALDKLMEIVTK